MGHKKKPAGHVREREGQAGHQCTGLKEQMQKVNVKDLLTEAKVVYFFLAIFFGMSLQRCS